MKWYFALNEASVVADELYANCAQVAVLSALQHTSLSPHLIYDGQPCQLTDRLGRLGASVTHHRSHFADVIIASKPNDVPWQTIALGAYLRLDIPLLDTTNEFVLYTDCDVIFLKDPKVADLRPTFFAAAPEFDRGNFAEINTGVMVINLPAMRRIAPELDRFVRAGVADFDAFDQGALRTFFHGRYDPLPEELNWKPYWGLNVDAQIIHFHGPKPPHVRDMIQAGARAHPQVLKDLLAASPDYYRALDKLWHGYLERVRRL
jgi:lipopolysaccharide biosynthesis glycosyltransferase